MTKRATNPRSKPVSGEAPSFDAVLAQLRDVVEKLESGELSLEQALAAYELGVGLARQGQEQLDAAEQRVELLMNGPDGIARQEIALDDDDDDPEDDDGDADD